jgi:hypothetical protein
VTTATTAAPAAVAPTDLVTRMTKDIRAAATSLTADEVRFLVDAYYNMQDDRKRFNNQARALSKSGEPNALVEHLGSQSEKLEDQVKKALDKYTRSHPVGAWMRQVHGVGPITAAGILAHVDIAKCPTVGHVWRYAGLDPTSRWEKGCKRPWNARLKLVCWHIGQSFMKKAADPKCYYGRWYRERKAYEVARNESGANAAVAAARLATQNLGTDTDAFAHLTAGRLPPAQLDARARRWAVKLFLSHLHEVWYEHAHGTLPPKPYALTKLEHAHKIEPYARITAAEAYSAAQAVQVESA